MYEKPPGTPPQEAESGSHWRETVIGEEETITLQLAAEESVFTLEDVGRLRGDICEFVQRCSRVDIYDVRLVASELLANAIEHSEGRIAEVSVECVRDEVVAITVVSRGTLPEVERKAGHADDQAERGRGTAIVSDLAIFSRTVHDGYVTATAVFTTPTTP